MAERVPEAETEIVGALKLDGESRWMAWVLPTDAGLMMDEIETLIDGSYLPGQTDTVDGIPFITVEIRRMPEGFVAALSEFEGW